VPTIILTADRDRYPLDPYLEIFEDPTGIEEIVYLHFRNETATVLPLTFWPADALADHSRGETLLAGLLFGTLLILLAYTLVLGRIHRQNARLKAQVQERTAELQESEERFRAVVEGSVAGILVHRETRPLFANAAYARTHGYQAADQILAMDSVIPLIAAHDRERMLSHHAARIQGDPAPIQYEYDAVRQDGSLVALDLLVTTIRWAGEPAVLATIVDRTQRKRAESALQERERFLATLNDITQAALDTPDLRTMTQTLADRVGDLFGADGCYLTLWDEGKRQTIPMAAYGAWRGEYGSIETEPGENTLTASVLEVGHPLAVEDVNDSPYLSPRIATMFPDRSLLGLPLIAGDEKLGVALIAFNEPHEFSALDIARGEQAGGQIALAIAKARLVEALRRQNVELQARNEELDAYARTVAHDLKNPLGMVMTYADFYSEEWSDLSAEQQGKAFQTIARLAQEAVGIVDSLLLLAQVRQSEVETEPLDMAEIVAMVTERLAPLIERRQGEIQQAAFWPVALGYSPWVEEVWANYIGNGLKYGGRPPRLELGGDLHDDGTAVFWVRDSGPGISRESQRALFTEFTRLQPGHGRGHGLGLSIVRRIVERLGGQVGVESEGVPGQGSTFFFTLPTA
jgi:PAS domain S-box-containing protein